MFGIGKKFYIAAAAMAALLGARAVMADTITVSDEGITNYSLVATGAYAGDEEYQYDIAFSATADVQTGDGFMVIDFGAVDTSGGKLGFTLTDMDGTPPAPPSDFTFSNAATPTGASSVNGITYSGGQDSYEFLGTAAVANDDAATPNAIFIYNSSTAYTGGPGDYLLTLYTTNTLPPTAVTALGSDHSGVLGATDVNPDTVDAPSALPLPSSAYAGAALIGLALMGRFVKARRELVA
jgi:hypothetical protein